MPLSWTGTPEFYVIAGVIAAAVVALAALPSRRGPAKQILLAGKIFSSGEPDAQPSIDVSVDDNRRILITRSGLQGIHADGAVSLAINIIGFDISIEERLTPGRQDNNIGSEPIDTAIFTIDSLAPERYHIKYNSTDAGVFTAFTLNVREGIHIHRPLR